jgi:hypothetical protein
MTSQIVLEEIPNQVVPIILWAIRDHLETVLQTEVPESNPTRAVLVKVGRFQENPVSINVSVSISGGDFEEPRYIDARIDNPSLEGFPIRNLPVGEIGGGHYWYRRGTIDFKAFFVRQRFTEDVAMRYAYDFYGRLLKGVESVPLAGLRDDYDEGVFPPIYVESTSMFEGGGKDKFIWRGKLSWKVLTWRP